MHLGRSIIVRRLSARRQIKLKGAKGAKTASQHYVLQRGSTRWGRITTWYLGGGARCGFFNTHTHKQTRGRIKLSATSKQSAGWRASRSERICQRKQQQQQPERRTLRISSQIWDLKAHPAFRPRGHGAWCVSKPPASVIQTREQNRQN